MFTGSSPACSRYSVLYGAAVKRRKYDNNINNNRFQSSIWHFLGLVLEEIFLKPNMEEVVYGYISILSCVCLIEHSHYPRDLLHG